MVTPVPGGVGPCTVACLMANTLLAARLQLGISCYLAHFDSIKKVHLTRFNSDVTY